MMNDREIRDIVRRQRDFFKTAATQSYAYRLEQLQKLKGVIIAFEDRINTALKMDLGKSEFESYASELGVVQHDISHTIRHLKKWMRPKRVRTPLLNQPASSWIHYTSLGVNLIISPFNYPFALSFSPLIAAIAAGNTAVIKTSEYTTHTSRVIEEMIREAFDPKYIAYIPGGIPQAEQLLKQRFDHIFFTGSTRVGSIVMKAAASHLSRVTLELGAKSPCIVHEDANLDVAVNRIAFGKFINAGQTCIAPDFVMVHQAIKQNFLERLKQRIIESFGEDASVSPDFGRIINEAHVDRLIGLIDPDKVIVGGAYDRSARYISPTVMADVIVDDRVMGEEIFGPILPVLTYHNLDEVPDTIGRLPDYPLACYIFSESKAVQERLVANIRFGGGCINHCMTHYINPNLPFGGIGNSGMGSYHGFYGFECFSHKKSVLNSATWIDLTLAYPPYKGKLKWLRRLLR